MKTTIGGVCLCYTLSSFSRSSNGCFEGVFTVKAGNCMGYEPNAGNGHVIKGTAWHIQFPTVEINL